MPTPTLLAALRAVLAEEGDDDDQRALMVPRFADGDLARPAAPPLGVRPRHGAVLALLYPLHDQLMLPLTVRAAHLRTHKGEISLPGGAIDAADGSPEAAALREAQEEVGLAERVEIWGRLANVYIAPSNFQITPVVAWSPVAPLLKPAEAEVAAIIHVPLLHLLDPANRAEEERLFRDTPVRVPFFRWEEHKIWGATSIVLSQLAWRFKRALERVREQA